MAWASLSDTFYTDPRILDAGLAAAGLYAFAISFCVLQRSDGYVPRSSMARLLDGGDTAPLDALIAAGLVKTEPDGGYTLPEFLDNGNWTRARIEARSEQKRRAARARWDKANTDE